MLKLLLVIGLTLLVWVSEGVVLYLWWGCICCTFAVCCLFVVIDVVLGLIVLV